MPFSPLENLPGLRLLHRLDSGPRVLSHLHSVQRYPLQRLHLDVLSFWKHISSSLPFSPPPHRDHSVGVVADASAFPPITWRPSALVAPSSSLGRHPRSDATREPHGRSGILARAQHSTGPSSPGRPLPHPLRQSHEQGAEGSSRKFSCEGPTIRPPRCVSSSWREGGRGRTAIRLSLPRTLQPASLCWPQRRRRRFPRRGSRFAPTCGRCRSSWPLPFGILGRALVCL